MFIIAIRTSDVLLIDFAPQFFFFFLQVRNFFFQAPLVFNPDSATVSMHWLGERITSISQVIFDFSLLLRSLHSHSTEKGEKVATRARPNCEYNLLLKW